MPAPIRIPKLSDPLCKFKNRNESALTHALKWAAWKWLWEVVRCRVIGFEVRLEGPTGRISDVVGLGPDNKVFLIEVKSSRPDLQRDDNNERTRQKLLQNGNSLIRASQLSKRILNDVIISAGSDGTHAGSRSIARAAVDAARISNKSESNRRRIETLSTKFHDPAYLRCADYHYIMAPDRMIRVTELPDNWGLLNEKSAVVIEAPAKQVKRVTQQVLRSIARANTRDLMKACQVYVRNDSDTGV